MSSRARSGRILVLCPYPEGVAAGQRLKFEQYYEDWRAHGWVVTTAPFMDLKLWEILYEPGHVAAKCWGLLKGYLRRIGDLTRLPRYDLIYCHMYVTPLGTSFFERVARRLASRMVFDLEDNVLVGQTFDDHPNPLLRFLRGSGKYSYLIRTADHVITSSPALNERCLEINAKRACTYISSSMDAKRFEPANRYSNEQPVTIGWTGTFSTRPFLDLLRPVFQRLAKERPFRLRVIGNFDYDLPGVDLDVIRWAAEREVEDLQVIDIGVYPLPQDDWVSGKSGLKAIQYMMMGLPCVASRAGINPLIVRDGETGILASSDLEWAAALRMLIDDPQLRERLGRAARNHAVARFSLSVIGASYREVLEQVLGEGSGPRPGMTEARPHV